MIGHSKNFMVIIEIAPPPSEAGIHRRNLLTTENHGDDTCQINIS